MNVLFLIMEFAPVNTTGNYRSLKFVKYLSNFGITPIIITLKEIEASRIFNAQISPELNNDIPFDTVIYRISCSPFFEKRRNRVSNFLNVYFKLTDDIGRAWKRNLYTELPEIIEKHKPELIYTSLPPFSSGPLARDISKKFKLPLVLDMRDLWSYWGSDPNGTYLHFLLKKQIESSVFNHASKIIGVTPQIISIFSNTHPTISLDKFEWIPNGFDSDLTVTEKNKKEKNKKHFVIGYIGSFYYNPGAYNSSQLKWWKRKYHRKFQYFPIKENWLYRSPYFFFKALAALFKKYPDLKSVFRFDFVGREQDWLLNMLKEFDLLDIYNYRGFQPYEKTLAIQKEFDAFLATSEKVEQGEHYCLPSKIFDYVQNGKPILAFVTEGIQKVFLINSGLAVICDPENTDQCVKQLELLYFDEVNINLNRKYLQQYHRKESTKKLAGIFKSLRSKNLMDN
ncbi:MAG: hypothetical protein ACTHLE_10995 [Agriterribacter sp.]